MALLLSLFKSKIKKNLAKILPQIKRLKRFFHADLADLI